MSRKNSISFGDGLDLVVVEVDVARALDEEELGVADPVAVDLGARGQVGHGRAEVLGTLEGILEAAGMPSDSPCNAASKVSAARPSLTRRSAYSAGDCSFTPVVGWPITIAGDRRVGVLGEVEVARYLQAMAGNRTSVCHSATAVWSPSPRWWPCTGRTSWRSILRKAVENGLSVEELVAAITQLAFYAGWPNALTAMTVLREAVGD